MSLLSANLEAFVAISRVHTVQGAALELGITQTGVTQRIRSLEQHLSTTLFIRSRRGMQLTAEGQALLRYCICALDLEGEALSKIQKSGTLSEVRFCITGPTSIISSRVTDQTLALLKKFPELLLTFKVSDLDNRIEELKQGNVQLAIVSHEQVTREMDSKILKPEKYVLVGPSSWKGRTVKKIIENERIIDFNESDKMTFNYLEKFNLQGEFSKDRHFTNNNESLIAMLKAGAGYGVLTLEVATRHLQKNELAILNGGAVLESPLAIAWYPRPQMPAYFSSLINIIK